METTLITGGTGKTGRRIARRLAGRGIPHRVGSRAGDPPFDWRAPESWQPALRGVENVYISYYPDLAAEGAPDAIEAFAGVAVRAGVRHLVLLAGRGEAEAERCERIVQGSGASWTVLRASWFCQNFSESFLLDAIVAGDVVLPVGDVGEPFLDADDIADVAVAALTEPRHAGQLYELTGPRLWSFPDAVSQIAAATGRTIRFTRCSVDEYVTELERAGLAPSQIELFRYLFTEVLDGRNARVTNGVMRALGREPRGFSAYVHETAATGVWGREGGAHAACGGSRASS